MYIKKYHFASLINTINLILNLYKGSCQFKTAPIFIIELYKSVKS
nr:MAG TPA: hypothetical protein [Caudoviricetes sp.]